MDQHQPNQIDELCEALLDLIKTELQYLGPTLYLEHFKDGITTYDKSYINVGLNTRATRRVQIWLGKTHARITLYPVDNDVNYHIHYADKEFITKTINIIKELITESTT